jgi:hypothetical protein
METSVSRASRPAFTSPLHHLGFAKFALKHDAQHLGRLAQVGTEPMNSLFR